MTRKIAKAIGVSSLILPTAYACGGKVVVEGSSGSGAAGSGSTSGSGGSGGAQTTTTVAVSSATGGPECTEATSTVAGGGQVLSYHYSLCLDSINVTCPADTDAALIVIANLLNQDCCTQGDVCEYLNDVLCGPYPTEGGQCCFEITTQDDGCAVPGRPYLVNNTAVTATIAPRDDWRAPDVSSHTWLAAFSPAQRRQLAQQWTQHALAEHASVASFAQFALELLALGAPANLVADANRAALEEVTHAQLAFALASTFGGDAVGPGPLPMCTLSTPSLAQLAVATLKEGCINETLSTLLLAEQLQQATHPEVKQALATMVADETRHAELAWRTVAWAIGQGGEEVRAAVAAAVAEATAPALVGTHHLEGEALAAAPAPAANTAQRIVRDGFATLIVPCAQALLAKAAPAAPVAATARC
ncbi:MAG TPA: ferritin-like domain-containing protein [Sorangium sp.]|nr:ferritin-like domain-containing protein [Sorangium sp.]